jgi:Transposase IS116/IS110/IS902 family
MGQPTAAAILTAMGAMHPYKRGKQLVNLAGLAIRWCESGSRIRKLPKSSHVGSASLRPGLYHYARRLVAPAPHCKSDADHRKRHAPGKGAGQRALMAVCDPVIHMIYRILIEHVPYAPTQEQPSARYDAARTTAV